MRALFIGNAIRSSHVMTQLSNGDRAYVDALALSAPDTAPDAFPTHACQVA